jgi:hypothetical protein
MFKSKLQIITFINIPFIIAFPAHFLYSLIPFPLFGIYFPTKESIFEHTKLIFTPYIITYLIFYLKNRKSINLETYLSSLIISIASSLVTMLASYYIFFSIFKKDIVFVSILCLLIAITLSGILSIYTYKKNINWSKEISLYILITMTFTLLLLTINPPYTDFFIDKSK